MTNLEGRVIRRNRAMLPPAGVKTDLEVMDELAARLDARARFGAFPDPASAFAELRRASAGGTADYAGISYDRIDAESGVFWPCLDEGHVGTKRLFADRFHFPDGRARFNSVQPRDPHEVVDADYPLWLTTGRTLAHYQSGTQTRRIAALAAAEPDPFVEVHPDTAKSHGIAPGEPCEVATRRGRATLTARYSRKIRLDTLFVPFHWGGRGNANILTSNEALDPISRMPAFKVSAARIAKLPTSEGISA